MIEVTKDEFYKGISYGDVVSKLEGNYPYKTTFKFRYGGEVGMIQDHEDKDKPGFTKSKYHLTKIVYDKVLNDK